MTGLDLLKKKLCLGPSCRTEVQNVCLTVHLSLQSVAKLLSRLKQPFCEEGSFLWDHFVGSFCWIRGAAPTSRSTAFFGVSSDPCGFKQRKAADCAQLRRVAASLSVKNLCSVALTTDSKYGAKCEAGTLLFYKVMIDNDTLVPTMQTCPTLRASP
jgi:hypothetical protein